MRFSVFAWNLRLFSTFLVSYFFFLSVLYDSPLKGYSCCTATIRLSEKFLSFYEEIIDAQHFLFYIILSNYVRSILFCWDKHRDISQPWFHVCMVVHCCKKHVCERKRLSGQPNMSVIKKFLKFKEIIDFCWCIWASV